MAVAVKAGQGQVLEMVFATFGDWSDMIYRKANVLPCLVGAAVLSQEVGAQANLLLNRGIDSMGHRLPLEALAIAPGCG